jgi:pilus assembly protein CpaF
VSELSLEIVEGPSAGRSVTLHGPLEIGRGPGAGFQVDDEHVDPLHVRVTPEGDAALVEDLGELGGTFVNDSEVGAPTRIRPGDELQIGVTVLQLRTAADVLAGSAARPKPAPLAAAGPPPASVPAVEDEKMERVQSLFDVRTKAKARDAPLALLVIVVFAVLIFLATNRF